MREAIRNNRINEGLPKILPGSITGTERWYKAHFKNAMVLVREYGKPTFFITFTMDVGCDEVKSQLAPHQSSYDRPDLLNREFEVKRKEFMKDVTQRGAFGVCNAHVSSIEFQKRGAPHMHLIIWIENFSKTPSNIDNIICAEIPPKGRPNSPEQRLYDLVMKHMIHGPCGSGQRQLGCCKKGKSSRKYPRPFTHTEIKDDSFAIYRRRDASSGGNEGTKMYRNQEVHITNQWVVPYSPYLLLKYASHVNVEYCHSIKLVKYLFKYQLKGEDMITVGGLTNEIAAYSHKRYISATLAHWRIAEFDIVQMKPSVTKLDVHLQDQQFVCYQPNLQSIVEALESAETTTLIGFFEANACPIRQELARTLSYEQFPNKFTWNSKQKLWSERKQGYSVGRIINIHPKNSEEFHLRMLLKHRKGVTSFDNIRTVEGIVHPTYKSACIALNLCEDDNNWICCLTEAVQHQMPIQ